MNGAILLFKITLFPLLMSMSGGMLSYGLPTNLAVYPALLTYLQYLNYFLPVSVIFVYFGFIVGLEGTLFIFHFVRYLWKTIIPA